MGSLLILCLLTSIDPVIRQLKAEEHSILDELEDAQGSRRALDARALVLERRQKKLQSSLAQAEESFLGADALAEADRFAAQSEARALLRILRHGTLRALLSAQSLGAALRGVRVLTRFVEADLSALALRLSAMHELDERRSAYQKDLDDAKQVAASLEETRAEAAMNQAVLSAVLGRVREARSEHERAYYDSQELAAATVKPSDSALAHDSFFAERGHLRWPAQGAITERFGPYRDPSFGTVVQRAGVSIAAHGPVYAVATGTVTFSQDAPGLGQTVVIEHTDLFATVYSGLQSLIFKSGTVVPAGAVLGRADHALEFEIRRGILPEDPLPWLLP